MGIKTGSFFGEATDHITKIHRELEAQSEYLRVLASTDVKEEAETFRWLKSQGNADTTGQLLLPMENRTGFALELVSWSAVAGATSNGGILFFLNAQVAEPQSLIWSAPQTQYGSDKFTSGMIVPVNGFVTAQFLACGSGQLCFANVLARRTQVGKTKPYPVELPGW